MGILKKKYKVSQKKLDVTAIITSSNVFFLGGHLVDRNIIQAKYILYHISIYGHVIYFQSRRRLYNRKCLSVCLSVTKTPQPLRIMPISQICPSAIMPPCPPLSASQNHNYWPSILSAIMPIWPSDLSPAFLTFKPLRLFT